MNFAPPRAPSAATIMLLLLALLLAAGRASAAERLRVAHSTLTATNSVLWEPRDRKISRATASTSV